MNNDENTLVLSVLFECVIEPASSMHFGRHECYLKTSLDFAEVVA